MVEDVELDVLSLSDDGLLQLKLEALDTVTLLNDDGDPELDSLTFSICMIWRTRSGSTRFGPA